MFSVSWAHVPTLPYYFKMFFSECVFSRFFHERKIVESKSNFFQGFVGAGRVYLIDLKICERRGEGRILTLSFISGSNLSWCNIKATILHLLPW